MIRWFALFMALMGTAHALGPPAPVIDLDFTRPATLSSNFTFTRAGTVTGFNCAASQALVTFGPNVMAAPLCDDHGRSLGVGVWGQRIIQNFWARDLTQVPVSSVGGWVPTSITPALNQTGIDLVPNSASSITATADGGTICQPSINDPAQYKVLTAYVKRLVGSGAVWMTMDGVNWNEIDTLINTSGYTRVPPGGLMQSVNNRQICFRLDVIGDSVAVDYVNLENDINLTLFPPSTPVLTTTSGFVIVPPDLIQVPLAGVNPDNFTVVIKTKRPRWFGEAPIGGVNSLFEVNDGTTQNTLQAYMQTSALSDLGNDDYATNTYYNGFSGGIKTRCATAQSTAQLAHLVPPFPDQFNVVAVGYNTWNGLSISCNNSSGSGNAPVNVIAGPTLLAPGILKTLVVGGSSALGQYMIGYVQRVQVYNGQLQSGQISSILSQLNPAQPPRTPTYLLLQGGGHLLFTGAVQPTTGAMQCNHC